MLNRPQISSLSPKEKAAVLLISLGKDYAAELFKHLSAEESSEITLSIAAAGRIPPEEKELVVREFYEMCLAQKFISDGGIGYARDILEKALGQYKADSLIRMLTSTLQVRPFDFLRRADTTQLINIIHNEHPQTIALIMSYVDAKQAAAALMVLPSRIQSDVIERIADMDSTAPELVKQTEDMLERKMTMLGLTGQTSIGGIDTIVDIVNSLDRVTEKHILESLDIYDNELADDIRHHLFVFEDITRLSNLAVQRVLKEISTADLAIALKLATDEAKKTVFSNVPKRFQEMIKNDMDVMGPVRVRDVEEAQQRIVNTIRRLEDEGKILISYRNGGEFIA